MRELLLEQVFKQNDSTTAESKAPRISPSLSDHSACFGMASLSAREIMWCQSNTGRLSVAPAAGVITDTQ
jgi:hypothetical protein